jgi:Divergent InlB B-repeat domain
LGWLLLGLTPTTLAVAHSAAINQIWGPSLSDVTLSVIHSAAVSLTWGASLSDKTLAVAHLAPLNPAINLTNNTLKPGDTLWYSLSGFAAGIKVTMNVNQYSIVVTTDANGNYGPVNFPATSGLGAGYYNLVAVWNGGSITAVFTIENAQAISVTSNGNGSINVIDLTLGSSIPSVGTATLGDSLQIMATPNSGYQFAGWTDTYGILGNITMYPEVTVTVTSSGVNLIANFSKVTAQTAPINISSDSNGFVSVIDQTTGQDISNAVTAIVGHTLKITATPWNSSLYQFAGWLDRGNSLNASQVSQYSFTIVVPSQGINILASFSAITVVQPPPSQGTSYTAPGSNGDGQYWILLKYADGSIGFDDYTDYIYNTPQVLAVLSGPVLSGTVVTVY